MRAACQMATARPLMKSGRTPCARSSRCARACMHALPTSRLNLCMHLVACATLHAAVTAHTLQPCQHAYRLQVCAGLDTRNSKHAPCIKTQDCWAQQPAARPSMQEVVPRLIAIREMDALSTYTGNGPSCCTIC